MFVKRGADFTAEANGLRWLQGPVPEVLYCDDEMLVLPWLPPTPSTAQMAARFGHELAVMHLVGAPSFGAPWPGNIADLPLDNTPGETWKEWYAERRVLPFARQARDAGVLSAQDVQLIEDAVARAEPSDEPPSRIHGDLWSGNVHYSQGQAWLIDPAAHGGHRETDLAMLALFGADRLGTVLAAYNEAAPLADGWLSRVGLHQLHPLLVHCVLYGGGYRARTLQAARSNVALWAW